ncbi:MAG: chromosomal replication initiator protein DnaA [Chlamydia sp.]
MNSEAAGWERFLDHAKKSTSVSAFNNWLSPIEFIQSTAVKTTLKVPNIFIKEYLVTNFKKELSQFLPIDSHGEASLEFVIERQERRSKQINILEKRGVADEDSNRQTTTSQESQNAQSAQDSAAMFPCQLNQRYTFSTFIEGPSNQFVKSAAVGVANRPGHSYNPLFIHGGVGLGKTHLLHSIGHYVREHHKKLRVYCITTEAFINQIVESLRNKSIEKLKRFYRSSVDVLLVDDIQFLQNRANFEEEFCNTFETLINQHKQIVITSDKPPTQLRLSERMVARMEWGLVAQIGTPDVETRVAILQSKAELCGLEIPSNIAFHIAENIHHNVRQLEGALNRLSAYSRLLNSSITEDLVEKTLRDMFHMVPKDKITVEMILKSVAAIFQVKVSDLKGQARTKDVAMPRQVAMFLAKEMMNESLVMIGASFGKTHSTILHACKSIETKLPQDELLRRHIDMVRRNLNVRY